MSKLFVNRSLIAMRRIVLAGGVAAAALIAPTGQSTSWLVGPHFGIAYAEDVVLQDIKIDGAQGTTTTIPRVEVTGSNLGRDDLAKLFQVGTNPDEAKKLLATFRAASLHIPEVQLTGKGEFKGTLREFLASDINEGKIGKLTIAGFDGAGSDPNGAVNVKFGTASAEGINLGRFIDPAGTTGQTVSDNVVNGADHVLLTNIELSLPDSSTPATAPGGNTIAVKIPTAEGSSDKTVLPLQKGTFEIKSMVVDLPKASQASQDLSAFGYDKLDIGLKSTVTMDKAKKSLRIDEFVLSGVNAGTFTIKADFGNIAYAAPGASPETQAEMLKNGNISVLQLSLLNNGIFEKTLTLMAKQQHTSPDALKAQVSLMAGAMLPSLLGGDPAGKVIGDAVTAFVANPKSISIGARTKGDPIPFQVFPTVQTPSDILSKVTVTATANQ